MPPDINPVQFGQLIESVKHLTEKVDTLQTCVTELTTQVDTLNNLKNTGRGVLLGALIGGGGFGALVTKLMEHWK